MRTACPWPWKLHNSRLAQGGAVFGGGKGGSGGTTYQTQQVQIPPEVLARYNAVNARAEQAAAQPFQPYQGQFVAPLTGTQQQAIQQMGEASTAYQPYYQAATAGLGQAAGEAYPYYGQAAQSLQQGAQAAMPFYGQAALNIGGAQAAAAPYTGMATAAGLAGTQAVNPAALNIGAYQNPYLEQVVNPTMAALRQQQAAEQSQLMGSQAMRGAFGGDRGSIAAANLARQQELASGQTEAGLRSQAYQQALQAAQQQQGVQLGAGQANRAALAGFAPQALAIGQQAFQQPMAAAQAQQGLGQGLFGMGQGLAQGQLGIGQGLLGYGQNLAQTLAALGQGATQTGLAGAQGLLGAGTLEQQTQQALNQALYNQYLQQQGYPFQVAQFLANIAEGTGALSGSTTTGVTTQPTSFFSDERVKEDIVEIGRTHDGQKIIKFRYKDEPPGTSHIGLSAQDVERHHPEAVSETPEGIKAVDYDLATRHAEKHSGGSLEGLGAASEGGAVMPERAGLGFAGGGAADYSQQIYQLMTQGARATPGGGGNPYGSTGASGYMPPLRQSAPRQLMRASLPTPAPVQSELEQGLGALQRVSQGTQAATNLYKMGREGLVGSAPTKDNPQGSGGLLGRAGKWDPEGGWLGKMTSSEEAKPSAHGGAREAYAAGGMPDPMGAMQDPNQAMQGVFGQAPWAGGAGATGIVPPAQGGAARKLDAPKLTTPSAGGGKGAGLGDVAGAIDATGKLIKGAGEAGDWITDKLKMAGLENDALNNIAAGAAGMATGGRTGLAFGGMGALPGGQASNPIVPEAVLEEGDKEEKLQAPGLNPQSGGGGGGAGGRDKTASTAMKAAGLAASFIPGVGPFLGAGLNIGSAFVKNGGRIGYEDGGAPTDSVPAPAPTGVAPPPRDILADMDKYKRAIAGMESGGRYDALGPQVGGDRAYGKYQVMGSNIGPWSEAALGRRLTPDQFLKDEAAQEKVFEHRMGQYLAQHGNFPDAASMWHSGLPLAEARRQGRRDVNMTTEDYVNRVTGNMRNAGLGAAEPPAEDTSGGLTLQRYKSPMGVGISNRPERSAMDWLTSESTIVPGIAGIGAMLAGGSPYFLPNLGKGLFAGATAYGDLAKDIRRQDIAQQQADISQQQVDVQTMAELQRLYADMTKRRDLALRQGGPQAAKLYDQRLNEIQDMILARSGVVGGVKRTGAPGAGAPGGMPSAGAPAGGETRPGGPGVPPVPVTPPKIDEQRPYRTPEVAINYRVTQSGKPVMQDSDPNYYRDLARNTVDPQLAKTYYDQANALENNIKQTGQVMNNEGKVEFVQGWQQAKNQENYRAQNQKWQEGEANARLQRETAMKQLNKISDLLTRFEPGKWADAKGDIIASLRSVGFNIPDTMTGAPGASQIILKTAIQQAMDMANKGTSGMTNEKLNEARLASPHADLQPEAMQSIVADLKARLAYEQKFAQDFGRELDETPWVNRREFTNHWASQKDNDFQSMYKRATQETPVLGMTGPVEIGQRRTLSISEAKRLWPGKSIDKPVVVDVVEGQNGVPTYRPVRS